MRVYLLLYKSFQKWESNGQMLLWPNEIRIYNLDYRRNAYSSKLDRFYRRNRWSYWLLIESRSFMFICNWDCHGSIYYSQLVDRHIFLNESCGHCSHLKVLDRWADKEYFAHDEIRQLHNSALVHYANKWLVSDRTSFQSLHQPSEHRVYWKHCPIHHNDQHSQIYLDHSPVNYISEICMLARQYT